MTESIKDRVKSWVQSLPVRIYSSRFWTRPAFWGFLLVFLLTVWLIVWNPSTHLPDLRIGDVAPTTLRAPYDLRVEDTISTRSRIAKAVQQVPPVYGWDPNAHHTITKKIEFLFSEGRKLMQISSQASSTHEDKSASSKTRSSDTKSETSNLITPDQLPEDVPLILRQWVIKHQFDPRLENRLKRTINDIYRNYIATNPRPVETNSEEKLVVLNTQFGTERVYNRSEIRVLDLHEARESLRERLELFVDEADVLETLTRWLGDMLVPNFWPMPEETKRRREDAARYVQPLEIFIQKGKPIIRAGEQVNETTAMILAAYRKRQSRLQMFRWMFGVTAFVLILLMALYFVMEKLPIDNILLMNKPLFGVSLTLWSLQLIILKITDQFLLPALVVLGLPLAWEQALFYAMPFALGSMLWSFLGDRQRGGWFALLSSPVIALMLNVDLWAFLYLTGFGLIAVLLSRNYRFRFTIFTSGLAIGCVNALWSLILHMTQFEITGISTILRNITASFLAGPLTAMLVSVLIPLIENAFGILTDIKLLELSNLNAPLLRQLALQAPGTYFHSIGVGQLAESAAEAIGANALFVKVAALYHDIGKLSRPLYFVENQKNVNPHDKISPNVSRLIIFSHIKEGITLAKKYGLPSTIIDMIPQHHGTKPLTYFYGKARALARQTGNDEEPDENAYRYVGPKPQTKEAAILMIADGVEAASRSLKQPNPRKLQNVVDNIIRFCLEDGQLDESNLTLKELRKIREAMFRTLNLMFHQRVSYPGFDFGEGEERFDFDDTHERYRQYPPDSDEPADPVLEVSNPEPDKSP